MKSKEINLYWHKYKFFPYEKKFAIREVQSLLHPQHILEYDDRLLVTSKMNNDEIRRLVYFSHAKIEKEILSTVQFYCENGSGLLPRQKRQNTRYSVHGLHEYKGKFNPQVVRALFNIYNVKKSDIILDPFCGSGTTLVEAAHDGIAAKGTDINPLAVFIANAKINALNISASEIIEGKSKFLKLYSSKFKKILIDEADVRIQYLNKWFNHDILRQIEALRLSALELDGALKDVFLVIISNILRDYSLQEPSDLRIRRRFSPFPDIPLMVELEKGIDLYAKNIKDFQSAFSPFTSSNKASNIDIKLSKSIKPFQSDNSFDFAITSPPYATALPYIDTQRLSLVWLNLITAKEIKVLESKLIGSRDFNLKSDQQEWNNSLLNNSNLLPIAIHSFCLNLNLNLQKEDGFRKKALPSLLYRYFSDMKMAFTEVHRLLKKDKYFCLIVGHNHTKIGGIRTDIDTPKLLSYIGTQVGFKLEEIVELEAYQRYGLNSSNSVQKETLIAFKK